MLCCNFKLQIKVMSPPLLVYLFVIIWPVAMPEVLMNAPMAVSGCFTAAPRMCLASLKKCRTFSLKPGWRAVCWLLRMLSSSHANISCDIRQMTFVSVPTVHNAMLNIVFSVIVVVERHEEKPFKVEHWGFRWSCGSSWKSFGGQKSLLCVAQCRPVHHYNQMLYSFFFNFCIYRPSQEHALRFPLSDCVFSSFVVYISHIICKYKWSRAGLLLTWLSIRSGHRWTVSRVRWTMWNCSSWTANRRRYLRTSKLWLLLGTLLIGCHALLWMTLIATKRKLGSLSALTAWSSIAFSHLVNRFLSMCWLPPMSCRLMQLYLCWFNRSGFGGNSICLSKLKSPQCHGCQRRGGEVGYVFFHCAHILVSSIKVATRRLSISVHCLLHGIDLILFLGPDTPVTLNVRDSCAETDVNYRLEMTQADASHFDRLLDDILHPGDRHSEKSIRLSNRSNEQFPPLKIVPNVSLAYGCYAQAMMLFVVRLYDGFSVLHMSTYTYCWLIIFNTVNLSCSWFGSP